MLRLVLLLFLSLSLSNVLFSAQQPFSNSYITMLGYNDCPNVYGVKYNYQTSVLWAACRNYNNYAPFAYVLAINMNNNISTKVDCREYCALPRGIYISYNSDVYVLCDSGQLVTVNYT